VGGRTLTRHRRYGLLLEVVIEAVAQLSRHARIAPRRPCLSSSSLRSRGTRSALDAGLTPETAGDTLKGIVSRRAM
jgi:hypothetical protein